MVERGIVQRFDSICFSRGEENALLLCTSRQQSLDEDEDQTHVQEIMLSEIQLYSQYLAASLLKKHGVKRNDRILLLCKGHAAAELVAIMACLRIGAIFVPVDGSCSMHHASRIVSIAQHCNPVCSIIVSDNPELADQDPLLLLLAQNETNIHRYAVLTSDLSLYMSNDINIAQDLEGIQPTYQLDEYDCPMYIIYTSGSTGNPKGVIGTEVALINRINWQHRQYPYDKDDIVCRRTPLTFIDALAEMFAPLLNHEYTIPLWVPPYMAFEQDLQGLFRKAIQMGVNRYTLLPSQLALIIQSMKQDEMNTSSILVISSGEPLFKHIADCFYEIFINGNIVNLFGCTEVSGDVLHFLVPRSKNIDYKNDDIGKHGKYSTVSIGDIIDCNEMFIDENTGELYIAGKHVALGYYDDRLKTEERFLNLKSDGKIWFKTGDTVVRKDDGLLYWTGRVDNQVKIRGTRIEIDEATNALQSMVDKFYNKLNPMNSNCCQCCVIAVDLKNLRDTNLLPNLEFSSLSMVSKQLVAFVETQGNCKYASEAMKDFGIHEYLRVHLSPIFVPTLILQVDALPRTSSGKVDRNGLMNTLATHIMQSTTINEKENEHLLKIGGSLDKGDRKHDQYYYNCLHFLAKLIHKLIPGVQFSSACTFFTLGGDSLKAIELLWNIKQVYPFSNFGMSDLQKNTLAELAYDMNVSFSAHNEATSSETPVAKRPRTGNAKTSPELSYSFETFIDMGTVGTDYEYKVYMRSGDQSMVPEGIIEEEREYTQNSNGSTMQILWKVDTGRCVDATPTFVHFSKPIDSKVIYIGSHSGVFFCIDAITGSVIWKADLGPNQHIESSAALHEDGIVFISSYCGTDVDSGNATTSSAVESVGMEGGNLWAIDALTGALLWAAHSPNEIKSSPLCLRDKVWVADYGGKIFVHDVKQEGRIEAEIEALSSSAVFASPVLAGSKQHIIFASTGGNVVIINTNTFQVLWSHQLGVPVFSTPLWIDRSQGQRRQEQIVFACVDGSIRCFHHVKATNNEDSNTYKFESLWKIFNATCRPIFSTMCTLILDGITCIIGGSHDGRIRCFSLDTSEEIWNIDLGSIIFSSPFPLASSNHVVVCTTSGEIFILKCTYESCMPLHKIRMDGEIYSSPIVVDTCDYSNEELHVHHNIFIGSRDNCLTSIKVGRS